METKPQEEKPTIGEYQNKPVIQLNKFFSFGMSKAKLIVKNIQYIQKFVETDGKSIE